MFDGAEYDFTHALAGLEENARTNRDKGRNFEKLIKKLLQDNPEYGQMFDGVWLWEEDWPFKSEYKAIGSTSAQDIGVDLVAQLRNGGELCAIQCKFYKSGSKVPAEGVDSFLAASHFERFQERILVTTGDLTSNSWKKLNLAKAKVITKIEIAGWGIDWEKYILNPDDFKYPEAEKYKPHDYQAEAIESVVAGFTAQEEGSRRGQLIMPCGVGKSVVALWIAEQEDLVPSQGRVLYLVPSIALMSQTMKEWSRQRGRDHKFLGVCSDTKIAKTDEDVDLTELAMQVTTDPSKIASYLKPEKDEPTVVFSTYQSLPAIVEAQRQGAQEFDLVICDEAHRTTGIEKSSDSDESRMFTLVHDEEALEARHRLYMTATPRLYTAAAKKKAKERTDVGLFSMDDEATYGPVLYQMTFGKAVEGGHLAPYEVIVLLHDGYDEAVNAYIQTNTGTKLTPDYGAKLLGCWDALADPTTKEIDRSRKTGQKSESGVRNLRRCIAFANTIKKSKTISEHLTGLVEQRIDNAEQPDLLLSCEARHIDGTMNAQQREEELKWLRDVDSEEARVLTNARCLTEGVDVPTLDAVIFLEPKRSEVDVVQAVGRVMRTSPGKEKGYIVLPVLVEAGEIAEDVLKNSDFNVVWSVLRALRAHDERFDALVNLPNMTLSNLPINLLDHTSSGDSSSESKGDLAEEVAETIQARLPFEIQSKLMDAIFENVGDTQYWPKWAEEVAKHVEQITKQINKEVKAEPAVKEKHDAWLADMRATLNAEVSEADLTEMLAQHVVTLPVFEALFGGDDFALHNPVAKAMNSMLDALDEANHTVNLRKEQADRLKHFYESVKNRLKGLEENEEVDDSSKSEARLQILLDLYEAFFKTAMPKQVDLLGVAYTPVELVDFLLRSVDEVCKSEFGVGLTDRGVNIIEPFVGTGTFINRLLTIRSDPNDEASPYLISDEDLARKYDNETHANELLLLAHYMASVKIEEGYRKRKPNSKYKPFPGLALADTFSLTSRLRSKQAVLPLKSNLKENSERVLRQTGKDVRVIISNPPWSAGQKDAGEDNPNVSHPELENRISETYAKRSTSSNKSSLFDSYKKAIRWASDRINHKVGGVIGFVLPNGILDGITEGGVRACFAEEFTTIWVYNLRGDANKQGEIWKKEGDKVFGSASKSGTCLLLLVFNPNLKNSEKFTVKYREVADGQNLIKKFAALKNSQATGRFPNQWKTIIPDKNHDWINQDQESFDSLMELLSKEEKKLALKKRSSKLSDVLQPSVIASIYSRGIGTSKDAWLYSFSNLTLTKRISKMLKYREHARQEILTTPSAQKGKALKRVTANKDLTSFKWTHDDKIRLGRSATADEEKSGKITFDSSALREAHYRPFVKMHLYYDKQLIQRTYQIPLMFPTEAALNSAISISGKGASIPFSTLATDIAPDLNSMAAGGQVIPRHSYSRGGGETSRSTSQESEQALHFQFWQRTPRRTFTLCQADKQSRASSTHRHNEIQRRKQIVYAPRN